MKSLSRREQNRIDKQERILAAAVSVFAEAGFSGASMDAIAARAGLTKPTLYQYFASKDVLFQAMMAVPHDTMMLAFEPRPDGDLVDQLHRFAWRYAETVMSPEFLSLARLTIGEAQRFPDVGRVYQASGPDRVLAGLMAFMEGQRNAGRLQFEHADLAAEDFWGLILSSPRNHALHVPNAEISHETLERHVNNGIRVFLRAYSTQPDADLKRLATLIATNGAADGTA